MQIHIVIMIIDVIVIIFNLFRKIQILIIIF